MSETIVVTYAGDGFYPPSDSTFVHDGHEYTVGELMHMEIEGGMVKSHVRAQNTKEIRYFEFRYTLLKSETAEDNVRQLHQLSKARA